jgi:hypothetical protein
MSLRDPMALLTLMALLVGVVLVAVPTPPSGAMPPVSLASRTAPEDRPTGDVLAVRELRRAQETRAAQLQWGRDPFQRPAALVVEPCREPEPAPAPTASLPKLTGISLRDGDRWAIIDREIVREGECLTSGATVTSIERGKVTLRLDHEEWTLVLGDER